MSADEPSDREYTLRYFEKAIDNADAALKALFLINGGAAVAMMTFVGSLVSADQSKTSSLLSFVAEPLMCFSMGVAVATLATLTAYLANFANAKSYQMPELSWYRRAAFWTWFSLCSAVASLLLFMVGAFGVYAAVLALSKVT